MNAITRAVRPFLGDRKFYSSALAVMIPVAVQQLINSLFNMVDNLMVGSLDVMGLAMSAVSVANKPYMIFNGIFFGMTGGAGLMISQYFGAGEKKTCQGLFSLQMLLGICASFLFFLLLRIFPRQIMGIFVKDPATIELGIRYLNVVSISYLPAAVGSVCIFSMRSLGQNRVPMVVSLCTMGVNALANYVLIFGKFGAPALGVVGAAWGTLIARLVEMSVYLYSLASGKSYFSLDLKQAFRLPWSIVSTFIKKAIPLILNEVLWSVGLNVYFWCYARLDEASIPAISIGEMCNMFASVLAFGVSSAVSVMIGTELGAGRIREAKANCKKLLGLDLMIGAAGALLSCTLALVLPNLYNLSPELRHTATLISLIMGALCPFQFLYGFCFFCLRAGGDTKNAMLLDSGYLWLIPVPAALLMGWLLPGKMALWTAVLIIQFLMYIKVLPALWILRKGKWLRNITAQ